MNRETGKPLSDADHLRQSIRDILSTRIGTRTMLRDYGSNIPELVDEPINRSTIAAIKADVINALNVWEPRMKINRVTLTEVLASGQLTFDLELVYLPNGQVIALKGVTI
ncbi:MAG: baseplate assembly protein W [Crocinitomicaceae bacterium]|nr:baseplate assembly protein W [Crocinitomicaceae bacterium]